MKNKIEKLIFLVYVIAPTLCFGQISNIVIGASPNNEDGDPPRTAYMKMNANAAYFAANGLGSNVASSHGFGTNTQLFNPTVTGGTITSTNSFVLPEVVTAVFGTHDIWITNGFAGIEPGDDITILTNAAGAAIFEQPVIQSVVDANHAITFEWLQHNLTSSNVFVQFSPSVRLTDNIGHFGGALQEGGSFYASGVFNYGLLLGGDNNSNNWQMCVGKFVGGAPGELDFANWGTLGNGAPLRLFPGCQSDAARLENSSYLNLRQGVIFGWGNPTWPPTFANTGTLFTNEVVQVKSNNAAGQAAGVWWVTFDAASNVVYMAHQP